MENNGFSSDSTSPLPRVYILLPPSRQEYKGCQGQSRQYNSRPRLARIEMDRAIIALIMVINNRFMARGVVNCLITWHPHCKLLTAIYEVLHISENLSLDQSMYSFSFFLEPKTPGVGWTE